MNLLHQTQHYLGRRSRMACAPLFAALLMSSSAFASDNVATNKLMPLVKEAARVNVTGTVKDAKGEPLPGVTVKIKGTTTGTTTDINGVFRLNLPTGNETLVFTFLGFKGKEVRVNGQTTVSVTMEESANELNAVVVTGYGTKKKSEIIGSVATISGEEIQDIPAPNVAAALRGRIAGVGVSQSSGRPGSSITLNVRNATASGSVAGATAEPLYIIDGITVDKAAFDNLDPSMVENMTILKDASAAIYGASGAKGVVLITTKRGKAGKIGVSYNGYMGVSDASRKPEMLSAYEHASLLNETYKISNAAASDFFTPADLDYIKTLNHKSWYDELWQSSLTQRHNLSISGGSDKVTFFAGGSYSNENANYAGAQFDRYSFRSGLVATMLKGLKADVAFNVDHSVQLTNHNFSDNDATFFESIVVTPQWIPISIDGKPVNHVANNLRNPLGQIQSGYFDNRKSAGYRINASLSYEPAFLKGLTARLQVSQGSNQTNNRQYNAPYRLYNFVRTGSNNQFWSNEVPATTPFVDIVSPQAATMIPTLSGSNSYQGFFTLKYANTFGAHTIDATAGGEQTVSYWENLAVKFSNQLIPEKSDWWAFNPSTLTRESSAIMETTKRSFFGRLSYDFSKKYLVEGVARIDASSNFARGNRWGLSPSLGLGWIASNETFFKDNISFINFLKFKVNYGITGDDRVGDASNPRLWQERYAVDAVNGYLFGTANNGNGLNPSSFPNPLITWEKKKTFNAGFEASFLNSKVDLGVEFFRNKTYDGFDRGAANLYPLYAGFTPPVVNYREYYNWGSEFTVGYKAKLARDLNLNTNINFGWGNSVVDKAIYTPGDLYKNRVGDDPVLVGTDPRVYNGSNFGLRYKGILRTEEEAEAFRQANPNYKVYNRIPEVGWSYYEDTNGDGVISDLDMVPLYKNTNSFFSSGISLNLSYKSLSLSTNLSARLGGKVFYDSRARNAPSRTRNVLSIWNDRWTPENPNGFYPRFDDPTIAKNSDFWAVDGTMIRVNNMTLSYRVPAKFTSKLGMSNVRLLATGNNLWTIVNPLPYKDPYTSSGYDYPMLRTISAGLSVNF
ncbi:SusC/RagA family TonB-linked outer membrane protein [Desertivirga brevis]|uniref:SusC/RagA family TonB-linked outer membrane protein n=1 Tax=Desertivirga brevis TaxID=2810310 RepID=UPI001F610E0B|nr:TonB-dependent receptor [Pedobacter sp. SYSU D00873]